MDWIVLAIGAIFLICMVVGIYRGAIKIAVSLAATVVTLIIVFFATPFVAKAITEYTPVDSMIKDQVIKTMSGAAAQAAGGGEASLSEEDIKKALNAAGVSEDMLEEQGISIQDIIDGKISSEDLTKFGVSGDLLKGLGEEESGVEEIIENADIPRDLQIQAIENAQLPDIFKTLLTTNNNDEIYKELGVKTFAQYIGAFLSQLIIHIVAFLCTFIIVTIIIRAIVFALDIVADLPVLGAVNRILGGVVGLAGAVVIVWFLFIIITLLYMTGTGREVYEVIRHNGALNLLYEYNPLMKLATNIL